MIPQAGMRRRYSRGEVIADAATHALGAAFGLAACGMLAAATLPWAGADPLRALALWVYAAGLLAMLGCSALYNLTPAGTPRKALLRRCDHAAIFAMIAGTYTPFAGVALGGAAGGGLLAFVWTAAAAGAAHALLGRQGRREGIAVLLYLMLGWCGVVLIVPLSAALSTGGLALLAAGGVLYSAGTAFHLAARLPYHNAAWHAFVLGAAACHFAAVLRDIAPAG
jgi:hemolysin III